MLGPELEQVMAIRDDNYYNMLKYRARTGAIVELEPDIRHNPHSRWSYRFSGSDVQFGPFKSKFAALLDAAHACHLSGADMNWEPIE